jgi:hypothetical protein
MKFSLKIFLLIAVLLAKYTLAFSGGDFHSDNSNTANISPVKEKICLIGEMSLMNENDTRTEGDDNDDEQFSIQTGTYTFLVASVVDVFQKDWRLFVRSCSGSLFLRYRNFRL